MPGIFDAFGLGESLPDPLPSEPFELLEAWFREARERGVQANPDAMTLATSTGDGWPSARVVLCKAIEVGSGSLVFYTNRNSRKGREMQSNPRAAACFHWDALSRQARVEGTVAPVSEGESDAYFASRPWENRLGAWASEQSEPIETREALLERVAEAIARLGLDLGELMTAPDRVRIPRPPHWGGFRLEARRVELWLGGVGRIHDRAAWERYGAGSAWRRTRLQP